MGSPPFTEPGRPVLGIDNDRMRLQRHHLGIGARGDDREVRSISPPRQLSQIRQRERLTIGTRDRVRLFAAFDHLPFVECAAGIRQRRRAKAPRCTPGWRQSRRAH